MFLLFLCVVCIIVDEHWPETRAFITRTIELSNRWIGLSCYYNIVWNTCPLYTHVTPILQCIGPFILFILQFQVNIRTQYILVQQRTTQSQFVYQTYFTDDLQQMFLCSKRRDGSYKRSHLETIKYMAIVSDH